MKIGITGGKGGTGKSTIAVNLASELSKKYRVMLLDMDSDCPNDHILLNTCLKGKEDVRLFLPAFNENCDFCGKCVEKCPEHAIVLFKDKIKVIPEVCIGCKVCKLVCPRNAIDDGSKIVGHTYITEINDRFVLGTAELSEGEKESVHPINAMKKRIPSGYDFYIYDTPAGTHSNVVSSLKDVDVVIAVTEPTPFGVHDLELILRITKTLGKKTYVIVNRSDVGNLDVESVCKKYGASIIDKIKFDRKIAEYYVKKKLFDENVDAYKHIKKISKFLVNIYENINRKR